MTTPTSAASLSIATDKPTYAPGELVTLTATYNDGTATTLTVNVSATATDQATPPNTATSGTSFDVLTSVPQPMTVEVTDDQNDVWAPSASALGSASFTTLAPSA